MYYYLAFAVIGYFGYNKYKKNVDLAIIASSFKLIKLYHYLSDFYIYEDEDKEKKIIELIGTNLKEIYYVKDGKELKGKDLDDAKLCVEMIEKQIKLDSDFVVVKEKNGIRILNPTSEKELKKMVMSDVINKVENKLFLQIIFKSNADNKELDLKHNLQEFLIVDNKILGYKFLKWFLSKYENYNLKDNNYTIKLMDNKIQMFDLSSDKELFILKDKYEII
jgi:hypothetical protein